MKVFEAFKVYDNSIYTGNCTVGDKFFGTAVYEVFVKGCTTVKIGVLKFETSLNGKSGHFALSGKLWGIVNKYGDVSSMTIPYSEDEQVQLVGVGSEIKLNKMPACLEGWYEGLDIGGCIEMPARGADPVEPDFPGLKRAS